MFTMSNDSAMLERVAKGAQLLDSKDPGWENDINVEKLNMEDGEDCIRGQLYGDYLSSLADADMSYQDAYEYGFTVLTEEKYLDPDIDAPYDDWEQLGNAWKAQIEARS